MRHVNPLGGRVFMGTLVGDAPLHESLRQVCDDHAVQCGTVFLLGGLSAVTFRSYDPVTRQRLEPVRVDVPTEIVGGHGSISLLAGQPHLHLHLTVVNGAQVMGGHVEAATAFAVEFTLNAYDGAAIQRREHAATGLMLWDV